MIIISLPKVLSGADCSQEWEKTNVPDEGSGADNEQPAVVVVDEHGNTVAIVWRHEL